MSDISEVSDAQLVTMIARCSEVALAETYRRHGSAVYGLACRVLNNASEAEDVAQEVFLRLWNQPDRFDPSRGNLRSYLLTQSHARAVDTIRSLNAARRRERGDAEQTARQLRPSKSGVGLHALGRDSARATSTTRRRAPGHRTCLL